MSMSGRRYSTCALVGLALPLLTLSVFVGHGPDAEGLERSPAPDARDHAGADQAHSDPLRGLWMRYESRAEGAPLRFWYFHGDGKGLYRYGRVGLANTHSFDYTVRGRGDELGLGLRFRKPGEAHELRAVLEQDHAGDTWLTIEGNPRESGARYRRIDSSLDLAGFGDDGTGGPGAEAAATGSAIGDRIWIDYRNLATGGSEFHMYQLAATALDGRGVGWFHRGDFDDWSTESLTYRLDGDRLELFFDLREEPNTTRFLVVETSEGRELILDEDPRDYWATHRYQDGGRSFEGAPAFAAILALEGYLAGTEGS